MLERAEENGRGKVDGEEVKRRMRGGRKKMTKREMKAMLNGELGLTKGEIQELVEANGIELDEG